MSQGSGRAEGPTPPPPTQASGRVAGMEHFWSWSWVACVWGHGVGAGRRGCFFSDSWETASVLHTSRVSDWRLPLPPWARPQQRGYGL